MPRLASGYFSSSLASGSPLIMSTRHRASSSSQRFWSNGFCVLLLAKGLGQGSHSTHLRKRKPCLPSPRRFQTLSLRSTDTASNAAFSLSADQHVQSRSSSQQRLAPNDNRDLANDKVENWTSRAYDHLPFQPDFTLFEAIDEADEGPYPNIIHESLTTSRQSQLSEALSVRLVHLIKSDYNAAEQLKSEVIRNSIDLPPNQLITTHCFDRLLIYKDIKAYLDWLPLVSSCHLQQTILADPSPIPAAELHLNAILKITPTDLATLSQFLSALVFKQCFTKHIGFTIIRHLIRTQSPSTTIAMVAKICDMTKNLPISSEVNNTLRDFLVLQLANQGHLSKALNLLFANTHNPNDPTASRRAIYPLTYQVLADQLISKITHNTTQPNDERSAQLDKLVARWYMDDQTSLGRWLAPATTFRLNTLGLPALTKRISKRYAKDLGPRDVGGSGCHHPPTEPLPRLSGLFNSLSVQNHHPKFLKAAQVANELNRLLPLRDSFDHLRSELGHIHPYKSGETDEQYIKSIAFACQRQLGSERAAERSASSSSNSQHTPIFSRPDVLLLWSHSWMIFYQRSGQPSRTIDIFFDYFVPIGCDLQLFNRIRGRPLQPLEILPGPLGSVEDQKRLTLMHPTTGVLTVLYDALLSLCPPKLLPLVFKSFLAQPYRQPAQPFNTENYQDDGAHATARLEPNFASFRPFVRAFLHHKDVTSSLSALHMMHTRCTPCGVSDEGAWIDLLEWCASHSAGPRPTTGVHSSTWGSQRKRKVNGWDGKMKEQLVYSVLKRLLMSSAPASVDGSFLEAGRQIDPVGLLPPSAAEGDPWIEAQLNDIDWEIFHDRLVHGQRFPSSKLLHRVKSGFSRAGHRRGIKIMNRLIDWREAKG